MGILEAVGKLFTSERHAVTLAHRADLEEATKRIGRAVARVEAAEADMITGIEGDALAVLGHDGERKRATGRD